MRMTHSVNATVCPMYTWQISWEIVIKLVLHACVCVPRVADIRMNVCCCMFRFSFLFFFSCRRCRRSQRQVYFLINSLHYVLEIAMDSFRLPIILVEGCRVIVADPYDAREHRNFHSKRRKYINKIMFRAHFRSNLFTFFFPFFLHLGPNNVITYFWCFSSCEWRRQLIIGAFTTALYWVCVCAAVGIHFVNFVYLCDGRMTFNSFSLLYYFVLIFAADEMRLLFLVLFVGPRVMRKLIEDAARRKWTGLFIAAFGTTINLMHTGSVEIITYERIVYI